MEIYAHAPCAAYVQCIFGAAYAEVINAKSYETPGFLPSNADASGSSDRIAIPIEPRSKIEILRFAYMVELGRENFSERHVGARYLRWKEPPERATLNGAVRRLRQ